MSQSIKDFQITRFQCLLDRVIGDSQVRFEQVHFVTLELIDGEGHRGLGFAHSLQAPYPSQSDMCSLFEEKLWPEFEGKHPAALAHRINRPRGGNQFDSFYGFGEAVQIAFWDLASQQAGLPLAEYLGARRKVVPAYASGLDYHMSDAEFAAFFAQAADVGFNTFKVKIGNPDVEWDIHRLKLLQKTVGSKAGIMADANEAWTAKEAAMRLTQIRDAGIPLIWIEDPILRDDIEGLKLLRAAAPWTQINSGEYLNVTGRRQLLQAGGTDILNVHGRVGEVMQLGWLAADMGIPVSLGNTMFETGVHAACALPEVNWMEYSFLNYDHLIDNPIQIKNGRASVPDRPGLGFALSDDARTEWATPNNLSRKDLKTGPACRILKG